MGENIVESLFHKALSYPDHGVATDFEGFNYIFINPFRPRSTANNLQQKPDVSQISSRSFP